jgi:outer membrane immunogenic protein
MRSIALACGLLFGMATAAMAQAASGVSHDGDAALTYHSVHTNAPPGGGCGCFTLNGGGLSASWNFRPRLAVVAEFSVDHTAAALSTTKSLTLTSYLAGARYRLPMPWMKGSHALQPFAQLLVGGAHAGGGIAGTADGTSAFAGRLGGGIDLPVSANLAVRLIQADYYLTDFPNGADNHQNNILLGAGIVVRWSR